MEPTKSKALSIRPTDTELMPPPPKRIKRPKRVIDEESYTEAVSAIIARDFFPGLLEFETQQEYLDAVESRNEAWISNARRRLEQVEKRRSRRGTSLSTPLRASNTPIGFAGDTPSSVASFTTLSIETVTDSSSIDTNMSLDAFQSKYTSEDNESFYKLLDAQNQKRAKNYAWMWSDNNKLPSKMMLKQKQIEMKLLQSRRSLEDDGGKKDRLAIRDVHEKPARPDTWKFRPKNGLMFAADGMEDSVETTAKKAENESRAAPKVVSYANTRMPEVSEPLQKYSNSVPPSPSLSAVQHALSGEKWASESDVRYDGSETPRINGYAFVDDEPDIEPARSRPVIDLDKGDLTKNPFIIKAQSSRENLHHRMVAKNATTKRQSMKSGFTGKVDQTPVPKFPSSPRVGSGQLTPAAQRLWSKVGSTGGGGMPDAFGTRTSQNVKPRSASWSLCTPSK